ncbi:bath-40 [Symbiodinium pilosum]|uniref:Bath-40 protein n=1 Tax=Symbiodinium pilosum TaxID=2952 RepID=A0A812KK50_SYMPI|nr:bath-40 [Symbiodinium pilosum]
MVGREHVMGLAIGNELELLYNHAGTECIRELWSGGRLWQTFQSRVAEFDQMGFSGIPVTSVFTAGVLTRSPVVPFLENPSQGLVNTFLQQAVRKYGKRYAFTFNVYPYFDPNLHLDPGTKDKCDLDLPRVTCWDKPTCLGPNIMASARKQMHFLTRRWDDLFWIGEIGWSSPQASLLGTNMADCPQFSSLNTFQTFYNGFLEWDLTLPQGVPAPDHIFYFTLRDALNFGNQEHFGLLTSCLSLGCKIATPSFRPQSCPLPKPKNPLSWQVWGFAALGVLLALSGAVTCLYVRWPNVKSMVRREPKSSSKRRLKEDTRAAEDSDSSE